jgi:hypothetical protein
MVCRWEQTECSGESASATDCIDALVAKKLFYKNKIIFLPEKPDFMKLFWLWLRRIY